MVKSMTGYGSASLANDSLSINIEVKTLNSKFLDVNLRLPKQLADRELEIRTVLTDVLQRGKVSMTVDVVNEQETDLKQRYNEELFIQYYQALRKLADRVVAPHEELFKLALNSPDVIITDQSSELDETLWAQIKGLISEALDGCDAFRAKEGAILEKKFEAYVNTIGQCLNEIERLDPKRIERIRSRIKNNLAEFVDQEGLDKNRLEQELIYYIEKLDITEEKVRLKSHLDHFLEVLNHSQSSGKKLGFISQEIGREINTIGSKANDAEIQRYVVAMKEELEKIKEQLLNVL